MKLITIKNITDSPQSVFCISDTKKVKRGESITIEEDSLQRGELRRIQSIMKVVVVDTSAAESTAVPRSYKKTSSAVTEVPNGE